jgi:hypothetical protein
LRCGAQSVEHANILLERIRVNGPGSRRSKVLLILNGRAGNSLFLLISKARLPGSGGL